jgi:hypothetical protein
MGWDNAQMIDLTAAGMGVGRAPTPAPYEASDLLTPIAGFGFTFLSVQFQLQLRLEIPSRTRFERVLCFLTLSLAWHKHTGDRNLGRPMYRYGLTKSGKHEQVTVEMQATEFQLVPLRLNHR